MDFEPVFISIPLRRTELVNITSYLLITKKPKSVQFLLRKSYF
jgi:hypothetical protein